MYRKYFSKTENTILNVDKLLYINYIELRYTKYTIIIITNNQHAHADFHHVLKIFATRCLKILQLK